MTIIAFRNNIGLNLLQSAAALHFKGRRLFPLPDDRTTGLISIESTVKQISPTHTKGITYRIRYIKPVVAWTATAAKARLKII